MPSRTGPQFPAHIPVLRTRLPGELWGVSAYFNPTGSAALRSNLAEFSAGVRRQGLKLLVVELAFGDAPFDVPDDLCDRVVRRRSNTVLWQKERLLNIGISHLPACCDKVAWLDADVVFENPEWVDHTARQLESYAVVQPFEHVVWLPRGQREPPAEPPIGMGEGHTMPGMASVMAQRTDWRRALADFFEHGHSGFGWAARREILDRHLIYDLHVLGGGDVSLAHAFYGDEDFWRGRNMWCRNLTKAELAGVAAWGRRVHEDVQRSVGAVPGRILHLWHGSIAGRSYQERARILQENTFDPALDVAIDTQGCLCWSSDKPDLHRRARDYFAARERDCRP